MPPSGREVSQKATEGEGEPSPSGEGAEERGERGYRLALRANEMPFLRNG